jgi:uncharacterized protein DUF4154
VDRLIRSCVAIALVLCALDAPAQDVTEGALKGAFLYNFAMFTEWPAEVLPEGSPIHACIVGDGAVAAALERTAKGRPLVSHPLVVRTASETTLVGCHLVYVAATSAYSASGAMVSVARSPVLTISDVDEFARSGGIAQFFVDRGKMRFRVNLESAKRARLQLSARLLSLAELVHD